MRQRFISFLHAVMAGRGERAAELLLSWSDKQVRHAVRLCVLLLIRTDPLCGQHHACHRPAKSAPSGYVPFCAFPRCLHNLGPSLSRQRQPPLLSRR